METKKRFVSRMYNRDNIRLSEDAAKEYEGIMEGAGWATDNYIYNFPMISDLDKFLLMMVMARESLLINEEQLNEDELNTSDLEDISEDAFMNMNDVEREWKSRLTKQYNITSEGKEAMSNYDSLYSKMDEYLGIDLTEILQRLDPRTISSNRPNEEGLVNLMLDINELQELVMGPNAEPTFSEVDDMVQEVNLDNLLNKGWIEPILSLNDEFIETLSNDLYRAAINRDDFIPKYKVRLLALPKDIKQKYMDMEGVNGKDFPLEWLLGNLFKL